MPNPKVRTFVSLAKYLACCADRGLLESLNSALLRSRQWLAQDNPERKTNAILSRPLRCTWRSLGTQLVPVTGPINRSGPYKISGAVLLVCGEKGVKRGTGLHFISNPHPSSAY